MSIDRDIPRQAGVLPYRHTEGRLQILLVTSSTRKRWIIPKGNIEEHLGEVESARREAFEEAGVQGLIRRVPFGTYVHIGTGGPTEVRVFVMKVERVLDSWPESSTRRREWMPPRAARDRVLEAGLKDLLLTFSEETS